MITAIVYSSNTGYTRYYAELLGEATGLPVYTLGGEQPRATEHVIYLGWLMAGRIVGLEKARRQFYTDCVAAVGMSPDTEALRLELRRSNGVLGTDQLFYLQGGMDLGRLNPAFRAVLKLICRDTKKKLEAKSSLTPSEQETLKMATGTYSCVRAEHLEELLSWYRAHNV